AFVKTFKRDYVSGAELRDAESVLAQLGGWIADSSTQAPHSALGMQSPVEYRGGSMNSRQVVTWLLTALLVGGSVLGVARGAPAEPRARAAAPAGLSAGEWQSIATQIRERPYRLEPAAAGGHRAANPAQGWTVAFDTDGVGVQPATGDWTW